MQRTTMDGAESDCSSDSASILTLCYSSSSERDDVDRESAVLEPYLYEPEDSDSHGSAEEESSDSQDE